MGVLLSALASVLVFFLIRPGLAQNQDTTAALVLACDRAAASPSDTNRPVGVAGVASETLDWQIAIAACDAAAEAAPDNPRIMFHLGRAHAAAKADESARVYFSKASDLGYAAARTSLGLFYAIGRGGLTRNDDEALRLFRLAAEQGDASGHNNLGFFYETGRGGLPKDDSEAARHYSLATDGGDSWGQYNLGRYYQAGRGGLTPNDREAARLYKLAADQGHALAEVSLGFFYEVGRGELPKDDREAADLYKRAAEQGNAAGQNNLGRFYLNGRGGLTQNDQEAARLYRLAANQGNVFAEVSLGFFYETGRGGLPKDDREAARLYRLAAEKGDPIGQNKLATFYEEGRGGLPKDNRESARLYKLAAEQDRNLNQKQQASDAVTRLGLAHPVASPSAPSGVRPAIPVIGFLGWSSPIPNASFVVAFRQGLAETGYIEGENVAIEYRWANGQTARMPALALELVRRKVSVLVPVQATSATRAAKAATSSIPIVFAYGGDPVRDGIVASLNHPGGNVTGVTDITTELGGKRLSLLRDLIPQAATVGFLSGTPNYLSYEEQKSEILDSARLLGRQINILESRSDREYEATFAKLIEHQAGGLIVGAFTFSNTNKILALAALHRIPTIYPFRSYVDAGGLMSYGSVSTDIFRQVGIYTGRILKGAKPADLPVMTPIKFELVINLKTAKALGINIPETLLATADEVIQ